MTIGQWWLAIVVILLATGFVVLALRVLIRMPSSRFFSQMAGIFQIKWLYSILAAIYTAIQRIADVITSSFEGEGGLLWTFLLVILILSILSVRGR